MNVDDLGKDVTEDDNSWLERMKKHTIEDFKKRRVFEPDLTMEEFLFNKMCVTNAVIRMTRRQHNEELAALKRELLEEIAQLRKEVRS